MPDSEGGGVGGGGSSGVKKRQAPAKVPSFTAAAAGYSTDDSNLSSRQGGNGNNSNSNDKARRGGRRPSNYNNDPEKESAQNKANMIWMVLVIGLMFCLMDAMYIIRVLEQRQQQLETFSVAESQEVMTERMMQQVANAAANAGRQGAAIANYIPQTNRERRSILSGMAHITNMQRRPLTPQERAEAKRRRQEEAKKAEEARIKNIKMAALEALKAQHGGKLPSDLLDKALEDDEAFKPRPMSYYHDAAKKDDKARILQLFTEAGLKEMDDSTYAVLPTWGDVTKLYGNEPRIVGLEQCETFRNKGNPWDHFVSTAGTFNSGTNLMAEMLIHNCHMQARMDKFGIVNRGIRWQVPWGKHTPPGDEEYRLEHKSVKDQDVDANMILPAVTVRDPYYWMQSMCKHHYTASWRGADRCPNLTPLDKDKANFPFLRDKDYYPLGVRYADFRRAHQSLTGLWNDWYNEYKNVEFQRLFVRYEDLLFHPRHVAETVCKCAGGTMNRGKFQYVVDSAKKGIGAHGTIRTGYIDAIIKYGSERNRYNGYYPEDLAYARTHLDKTFMEEMGYKFHPLSLETHNEKKDDGEKDAGNEDEDEHEDVEDEHELPELPKDTHEEDEGAAADSIPQEAAGIHNDEDGAAQEAEEEVALEAADLGDPGEEDMDAANNAADSAAKEEPDIEIAKDAKESADLGDPGEEDIDAANNSGDGGQEEEAAER